MRKLRIFSSFLIVILFISFFSFNLRSGHFIQLGSDAFATPITAMVANQAYDTSGNDGRKLVRLSNGWLVAAVGATSSGTVYLYKSEDCGSNWGLWLTFSGGGSTSFFSLATHDNYVYLLKTNIDAQGVYCSIYNYITSTYGSTATLDSSQTSFSGCSLTIDSSGNLYATWCSKNSTYPNSFNIRFAKSTNGTDWTKADGSAGVDQLSVHNASTNNHLNPCIIIRSDGKPSIFSEQYISTIPDGIIQHYKYTTSWSEVTAVFDNAYTQSNPCAVVAPNGRIWVAWHGKDTSDSTYDNIRCKYSDDNGASWNNGGVSNEKITSTSSSYNQRNPSVACDSNNMYIVWNGALVSSSNNMNIREIVRTGSTWGSIVEVTSQSGADIQYPSVCENYAFFTDPLCIYQDNQTGKVMFRGEFGNPPITTPRTPTQNAALFPNLKTPERSA
jgi:hypothetical protein